MNNTIVMPAVLPDVLPMRDDGTGFPEVSSHYDIDGELYIRADIFKDGLDSAIQKLKSANAQRVLLHGFAGSSEFIKDAIRMLEGSPELEKVVDENDVIRDRLIMLLRDCNNHQQTTFRLMYGRGSTGLRTVEDALEMPLADVVREIHVDKLAWALKQVTNTDAKKT
jgi:hypothetical protein